MSLGGYVRITSVSLGTLEHSYQVFTVSSVTKHEERKSYLDGDKLKFQWSSQSYEK